MFAIVVKSVSQQKNLYIASKNKNVTNRRSLKPGFHYPSWRPELTGNRSVLPVNMGHVDARPIFTSRVDR